ncbi:MAG: hypothetical protein Q9P90_06185 [candidate division KSB1 bacterium]|nr:hypothetical protein [candidate division KSB1 bacterium]
MIKLARQTAVYGLLVVVLYGLVGWMFFHIRVGDQSVLDLATRNPVETGGFGFTLPRIREAETWGEVDILFLGSSHTYRSFDPRIFAEYGYRSFNLGTTGQTPINSYYVLKRYFPKLRPRLVILDIYRNLYDRDGLESFYDLSKNAPFSWEMVAMALALRTPHALNAALDNFFLTQTGRLERAQQQPFEDEVYVPGGYVETHKVYTKSPNPKPRRIELQEFQLDYLRRIIDYVYARGSRIVLVSQPEPLEILRAVVNYDEIAATFAALAEEKGVRYFDFNFKLPVQTHVHFSDADHLNPAGVRLYNTALIDTLQKHHLLPTPTNGKSSASY